MEPKSRSKWGIWFVGIALCLLIIGAGLASNSSAPISPEQQAKKAQEEKRFQTVLGGAITLRDRMREPESLKFSSVIAMENGTTCYGYRARNGFGGMNGDSAILISGTILITPHDDERLFRKEWNNVCAHKAGVDMTEDMNYGLEQYASTHH